MAAFFRFDFWKTLKNQHIFRLWCRKKWPKRRFPGTKSVAALILFFEKPSKTQKTLIFWHFLPKKGLKKRLFLKSRARFWFCSKKPKSYEILSHFPSLAISPDFFTRFQTFGCQMPVFPHLFGLFSRSFQKTRILQGFLAFRAPARSLSSLGRIRHRWSAKVILIIRPFRLKSFNV